MTFLPKNPSRRRGPLRIAIDGTALYGRYGGVAYALWNLLVALRDEDDEIIFTVFVPRDGPTSAQTARFDARFQFVRLPFCGAERLRRIAWQQLRLPRVLARENYDVFHAPTYVAPLRCAPPLVLTVYDLIALDHPQFATRSNRLHYGALLAPSIRRARRIIVPSSPVRDAIVHHGFAAKDRVRVVAPGVEAAFFDADEVAKKHVRARYNLPEKYLLFVGNFEPKKNLQLLLHALQNTPDAPPLVLAGGSRAWPHEARVLANAACARNIGYVARRDLPALYSACEAFVFPSLAEGFGLPVLEALAAGAPTLASTRVPIPHLESAALLCDPCDERAFAAQLQRVLSDEKSRVELRNAGPKLARNFSWRRAARETLQLYREAGH